MYHISSMRHVDPTPCEGPCSPEEVPKCAIPVERAYTAMAQAPAECSLVLATLLSFSTPFKKPRKIDKNPGLQLQRLYRTLNPSAYSSLTSLSKENSVCHSSKRHHATGESVGLAAATGNSEGTGTRKGLGLQDRGTSLSSTTVEAHAK